MFSHSYGRAEQARKGMNSMLFLFLFFEVFVKMILGLETLLGSKHLPPSLSFPQGTTPTQ
jgi:hypothetical protein